MSAQSRRVQRLHVICQLQGPMLYAPVPFVSEVRAEADTHWETLSKTQCRNPCQSITDRSYAKNMQGISDMSKATVTPAKYSPRLFMACLLVLLHNHMAYIQRVFELPQHLMQHDQLHISTGIFSPWIVYVSEPHPLFPLKNKIQKNSYINVSATFPWGVWVSLLSLCLLQQRNSRSPRGKGSGEGAPLGGRNHKCRGQWHTFSNASMPHSLIFFRINK